MGLKLGSVLVGSSQPAAMKEWYRAAFSVSENDMGEFDCGGTLLVIEEHSEVSGPAKEPARLIINFDVDDCRALEKYLQSMSVKWIREVAETPFGLIGTVADPDGNYVQIIQWAANLRRTSAPSGSATLRAE